MRKKIIITIFLFIAGFQLASAQVPGYQGKRFALNYNASTFFRVTNFGYGDGMIGMIESTRLSYKTELGVDYTVSRKVTMGLSYYFAKQNYQFKQTQISNMGYYVPEDGAAACKLSIYEMHFLFFRKNFIAPTGLYHKISLGIVKYKLASPDNRVELYQGNNNNYSYIIEGPASPFTCYKLGYAIGKTNPIGHNFYLNTSFGLNFFRGGDSALRNGILRSVNENITVQNYIRYNLNGGLRVHNFAEVKLGLGWLAF